MMLNDRYFTSEILESERQELFKVLSLDKLRFIFVESAGDVLIKVEEHGQGDLNSLIHIASRTLLDAYIKDYPFPVIELRQTAKSPSEENTKRELWENIFPYPLSCIGGHLQNVGLQVRPEEFRKELAGLKLAKKELEEKLVKAEVGLVRISSLNGEFYLLLHSVRGAWIRVGVPHEIEAFFSTFRGSNPNISDFETYFGTSVVFAHVQVGESLEGIGILSMLSRSVLEAVRSSVSSLTQEKNTDGSIQIQL